MKKRLKKKIRIQGTTERPRLSVHRTNKYIYAQLINDEKGVTIAGVSEKSLTEKIASKVDAAKKLGALLAAKAKEKKVVAVVFDRGSRAYHGVVKALAEGAREGGLKF